MKDDLFCPYKEMILRCIDSCINTDQLKVCHDMMDRFNELFKYSMPHDQFSCELDQLSDAYLQKQSELGF